MQEAELLACLLGDAWVIVRSVPNMKHLATVLSALMMGLIAMPLLVMVLWPPTPERGTFGVDCMPLLALGTIVMVRDSTLGRGLPRGEIVFPLLFVCTALPLVSSLVPVFLLLLLPLGTLLWITIWLTLAVEVAATLAERPGLRWIRLAWCVLVCTSLVIVHLLSIANHSVWAIAGPWLVGAITYAAVSRLAGPLPPQRVLFGKLSQDFRTTSAFVAAGIALAAGALFILGMWAGDPAMDLPP